MIVAVASVRRKDGCQRFYWQNAQNNDLFLKMNIGVRPYEIPIKRIKKNQKFYKRNIKYLAKTYHE